MNGVDHLKIDNKPYMPLTIEKIGEVITTPFGGAIQYSLAHYYAKNGDLMRDPEMCFLFIDKRKGEPITLENVIIIPYMYQQDNLAFYEDSVLIINNKTEKYAPSLNADHVAFANLWLLNIEKQGFLI